MTSRENDTRAIELCKSYIAMLNKEFHDTPSVEETEEQCQLIALQLLELGFYILSRRKHALEKQSLPDGNMQSVIVLNYQFLLVRKQTSVQQPIFIGHAVSKVFGPIVSSVPVQEQIKNPLSREQTAWLDGLDAEWAKTDPPPQKGT